MYIEVPLGPMWRAFGVDMATVAPATIGPRFGSLRVLLLLAGVVGSLSACDGCEVAQTPDAGGPDVGVDAGTAGRDAGLFDAGLERDAGVDPDDAGTARDAGIARDAGPLDAGPPFSWEDIFGEAGVPEALECIPGTLPGFSLAEILAAFEFERYQGTSETGVVCGDVTCAEDVPCCELCGFAQCAEPGVDGGPAQCPAFVRTIQCDGHEDCPNRPDADTCCYTLQGTECRAEADCQFELPSLGDGGFAFPFPSADGGGGAGNGALPVDGGLDDGGAFDAGASLDGGASSDGGSVDGGSVDGGALDAGLDAGVDDGGMTPIDLDAGGFDAGIDDAGPAPNPIGDFFAQGVPVCRNTLFDCSPLQLEVCCTSPRIVTLDIGMCLPALLCFNDILP